jgi:hypothetical protein
MNLFSRLGVFDVILGFFVNLNVLRVCPCEPGATAGADRLDIVLLADWLIGFPQGWC